MLYQRIPRLFSDLALARGNGRYPRLMRALGGVKLLILDDWGLEPLGPEQRHDMLEIVEDRYCRQKALFALGSRCQRTAILAGGVSAPAARGPAFEGQSPFGGPEPVRDPRAAVDRTIKVQVASHRGGRVQ